MSIENELKLPAYDVALVDPKTGRIDPLWYELQNANRKIIISQRDEINGNTAAIQQEALTRATADSAQAALITDLQAQVDDVVANVSIKAIAEVAPGGAYAMYDVQVGVEEVSSNLKVVVYETSPGSGIFYGVIRLDADQVEIGSSSSGVFVPLTTFDSGTNTVYIYGDVKATKDNLVAGSASNSDSWTHPATGNVATTVGLVGGTMNVFGGRVTLNYRCPNATWTYPGSLTSGVQYGIACQFYIDGSPAGPVFYFVAGIASSGRYIVFSQPVDISYDFTGLSDGAHSFALYAVVPTVGWDATWSAGQLKAITNYR